MVSAFLFDFKLLNPSHLRAVQKFQARVLSMTHVSRNVPLQMIIMIGSQLQKAEGLDPSQYCIIHAEIVV